MCDCVCVIGGGRGVCIPNTLLSAKRAEFAEFHDDTREIRKMCSESLIWMQQSSGASVRLEGGRGHIYTHSSEWWAGGAVPGDVIWHSSYLLSNDALCVPVQGRGWNTGVGGRYWEQQESACILVHYCCCMFGSKHTHHECARGRNYFSCEGHKTCFEAL